MEGSRLDDAIRGHTARELAASIETAIRESRLQAGVRLPTIRGLAAELGVSPMTVASAYRELRRRGLVTAAGRRGTRVSERPPLPVPIKLTVPPGTRDLATGNPDPALLPSLGSALAAIDSEPRLYGEPAKLEQLVELAEQEFAADGIDVPALAVVAGGIDAVERVVRAHLRTGDTVAVEDPGFARIFDLLRGLGLELAPVRIDDSGPLPDELEHALRRGARALIVTPRGQNPRGAALDELRTEDLRDVLREHPDVLVIEDDYGGALAGTSAFTLSEPDRPNWAIARSVSKSLGPDLRLAVLAGDVETIARVEGHQLLGTGWVSGIVQQLVVELWSDPAARKKIADAAEVYSARRSGLVRALADQEIVAHGRSGLYVWIPVPEEAAVVAALAEQGWAVVAGERWRLRTPPAIRITTATLQPEEADAFAVDLAETLQGGAGTYSA